MQLYQWRCIRHWSYIQILLNCRVVLQSAPIGIAQQVCPSSREEWYDWRFVLTQIYTSYFGRKMFSDEDSCLHSEWLHIQQAKTLLLRYLLLCWSLNSHSLSYMAVETQNFANDICDLPPTKLQRHKQYNTSMYSISFSSFSNLEMCSICL